MLKIFKNKKKEELSVDERMYCLLLLLFCFVLFCLFVIFCFVLFCFAVFLLIVAEFNRFFADSLGHYMPGLFLPSFSLSLFCFFPLDFLLFSVLAFCYLVSRFSKSPFLLMKKEK